jgi:hypothetical protein
VVAFDEKLAFRPRSLRHVRAKNPSVEFLTIRVHQQATDRGQLQGCAQTTRKEAGQICGARVEGSMRA